jgi:hypothetical protein
MATERTGLMPIGSPMTEIRPNQVTVTAGNAQAPEFDEDATAQLVWMDYQRAKNYVENNAWLLEWQETDILCQSPIPNRFTKYENGRPARVPRFLVAKFTRTLSRAVKRGLFAEQYPFFLRPTGKTTQDQIDAWSELIGKLLKRMKFAYHCGLAINCQVLQGTAIGKMGWEERTVTRKRRKRLKPAMKTTLPTGEVQEVPTAESDAFKVVEETATESWPFFEYRRLGTTLFDPKWCTPDAPDESAGYCVDVDYVTFADLQEMRKLDCYKNIPDDEALKEYFFRRLETSAPQGSQVEDSMTTQGSMVAHAEGRNQMTSEDPLSKPMMLLERWDTRTVKTILVYEGRKLTIRNENHDQGRSLHVTATWWPIDNNGYGMGIGRINGPDQRINQGVINECLKMIAYPFNAPLVTIRGDNAPTQNVIQRLGGFWQVDAPPGTDVSRVAKFLEMPKVPDDAWKMLDISQKGGEELSGANAPFQQGNLGGPGSSAARTATGASRIAGMSDQNVADPIDSVAYGMIVPVVEFLVDMVRLKMPLKEIREILSEKHAKVITDAIAEDQFIEATFEVDVLAGQKLAARAGIQQLIPFFLQIVQQPQLLQFLHEKGDTIDFGVMCDLFMQVSELTQQPDIFRPLTPKEMEALKQMNPGAQKLQAAAAIEQLKGKNKQDEIHAKGEVDLANKAAETVMQHAADGIPLERAAGLLEREEDKNALKNGLPDFTQ